ncbi:MAG TPA: D-glycerate dehydrogenase [Bacillales bacterium]|nr:D-glycerate dehydrogenase [Bacillales bacterium]
MSSKPYIFVTRKVPDDALRLLNGIGEVEMWPEEESVVPREVLLAKAAKADALITMLTDRIDGEVFRKADRLKIVANVAVGYDNIDVEAAASRGVVVTNTPEVLTDTTADLTFALLMATARRLIEANESIRKDAWTTWSPYQMAGRDVHHKTLGIVGMGRIGEAVAKRAAGFDMDVLYYNRSRRPEAERKLGVRYAPFDELLRSADFVVCLTPLTEETKHLFAAEAFRKMKKTAFFINPSRGAVVDEQALADALRTGEIAGAGLDVFEQEPISSRHPLLAFPNVTALPHIGSATVETRTAMIELAFRNVRQVVRGKAPLTPVQP